MRGDPTGTTELIANSLDAGRPISVPPVQLDRARPVGWPLRSQGCARLVLCLAYPNAGRPAGKTTLRLRLEQQLITEALPALEKGTARIPVLAVEAIAPESGQFNWKDYYARALVALNEPLLDRKVIVNAAVNPDAVRPAIRRSASAPALRWVLETASAAPNTSCGWAALISLYPPEMAWPAPSQ